MIQPYRSTELARSIATWCQRLIGSGYVRALLGEPPRLGRTASCAVAPCRLDVLVRAVQREESTMRQNLHPATPFSGLRRTVPTEPSSLHEIDGEGRGRAVLIRMPWIRARSESRGTQPDETTPAQRSTDRWAA